MVSAPVRVDPMVTLAGLAVGASAASVGVVSVSIGPLQVYQVLAVAGLACALVAKGYSRAPATKLIPLDVALVMFAVVRLLVEVYNAESLRHPASIVAAIQPLFFFAAYMAGRLCVTDIATLRVFLRGIIVVSIPVTALAVAQVAGAQSVTSTLIRLTQSKSVQDRMDRGDLVRATSTIGHWTGLGVYLCAVLAATMCLMILDRQEHRRSRGLLAVAIFTAVGLVTTLTFSVIICGVAILAISARAAGVRAKLIGGCIVGGAAGWVVLSQLVSTRLRQQYGGTSRSLSESSGLVPETMMYRFQIWWNETLPAIAERPVTGWGRAVYQNGGQWPVIPESIRWPYAESQWLNLMMTGGLLEFLVLVAVVVFTYKALSRGRFAWTLPARVLLVVAAIVSFTVPLFTNAGLPIPLWAICGGLASLVIVVNAGTSRSVDLRTEHGDRMELPVGARR